MWSRLGTRLPAEFTRGDESRYESGTEFEFEDALDGFQRSGRPDLVVYRKITEPLVSLKDESVLMEGIRQKRALDEFVQKWFHDQDEGTLVAAFHPFERADEFEELVELHLRKLIERRLPSETGEYRDSLLATWTTESPYRGLEVFDVKHSPIFFGRTRAVSEVIQSLRKQADAGHPFVVVLGMSGVGKSSLVRAGVIPLLTQPGVIQGVGLWRRAVLRPGGGDPFQGLANALVAEGGLPELVSDGSTTLALAQTLRSDPELAATVVRSGLAQAAARLQGEQNLKDPVHARLLLVVDQFEELFSSDEIDAAMRKRWIELLGRLASDARVWVLATLRSDFYPRCADEPKLVELMQGDGQYLIRPPTPAEMGQMIRLPAQAAGLRFEVDSLTQQRLDETIRDAAIQRPESVALMEFTLEALYRLRTPEGLLQHQAYTELGGVEGALARRAENCYESFSSEERDVLPSVLRALVTVGSGDDTLAARRVPIAQLAIDDQRQSVVDALIDARLLVTDTGDEGEPVLGLAHEALLRHWPRVRDWVEEDREFLRIRSRVSIAATHWRDEGELPELLLTEGKPLAEAEPLVAERRDELDDLTAQYIQTSSDNVSERRERIRRRVRRTLRRTRIIAGVFAIVGIAAFGFAVFSLGLQTKQGRVESRHLVDLARLELSRGNLAKAAEHALEALPRDLAASRGSFDPNAIAVLHDILIRAPRPTVISEDGVASAAISPGAEFVATGHEDGKLRVWSSLSSNLVVEHDAHDSQIIDLTFSPDGTRVATASADGTAGVWSVDNAEPLSRFGGHKEAVFHIDFSPDGARVASASADDTVQIWSAATGEPLLTLLFYVEFSPTGDRLLTRSRDETLRIWNAQTGEQLRVLELPSGLRGDPAWSASGTFIAAASDNETVYLWASDSENAVAALHGHTGDINDLEFSPDGGFVLTGSDDNTARLWSVPGGELVGIFGDHVGDVESVAFSQDGNQIATASHDRTVRVWDVRTGQHLTKLVHDAGLDEVWLESNGQSVVTRSGGTIRRWLMPVSTRIATPKRRWRDRPSVQIGPKGNRLLTNGHKGGEVWDLHTGERVAVLTEGHLGEVEHVGFAPDGERFATASDDHTARIWDGVDKTLLFELIGHSGPVTQIGFNFDGTGVVTASDDGTARIWNAQTGEVMAVLSAHEGPVMSATFDTLGARVITAGFDKTARVWDASTGELLNTLQGHERQVLLARFMDDGVRVITASEDGTFRVWLASTGEQLQVLSSPAGLIQIFAIDSDEANIAIADFEDAVHLCSLATGELLHTLNKHEKWINHLAFSTDGRYLVSASDDNTAQVWSVATGESVASLASLPDIEDAQFSRDGSTILTASSDDVLRFWDAATGTSRHERDFGNAVAKIGSQRRVRLSADGRFAVVAAEEGAAIFDAEAGKLLKILRHGEETIKFAEFSPDATRVVTVSDENFRIWNVTSGEPAHTLQGPKLDDDWLSSLLTASYNADASRVVGVANGKAWIWDALNGKLLSTLQQSESVGEEFGIVHAVFDPGGTRLVTTSLEGLVTIWDADSAERLRVLDNHTGTVLFAQFDPLGERLVTASRDGTARLWSTQDGGELRVLKHEQDSFVTRARFDLSGRRVLTVTSQGAAHIWDAADGKLLHSMSVGTNLRDAKFSPDGERVVTIKRYGEAGIWDTQDGSRIATIDGHRGDVGWAEFEIGAEHVRTLSRGELITWSIPSGQLVDKRYIEGYQSSSVFSPDRSWFVRVPSDGVPRVARLGESPEPIRLSAHVDSVTGALLSPDGMRVLTLSDDGTARIWDAATGHHQMLLAGHNRRIRCGGWSFDGRRVVTGDWERARIWDASTGNELLSIRHDGSVYQCSFNAEGTRLLSEDGKLKVWDLASGKLLFAIDPPKDDDFDQVEFTLEGSTILARYDDAWKLKLLDAHTGAELGELGALFAEIDDTDISSDSSRLAALSVLGVCAAEVLSPDWAVAEPSFRLALGNSGSMSF